MKRVLFIVALLLVCVPIAYYYNIKSTQKKLPIINPSELVEDVVDPELRNKSMGHKIQDFEFVNQNKEVSKPVVNDIQKLAEFSKRNNNVDLAGRFVYNKNEIACFNFGKHKGKPVEQVLSEEPSYYSWMMKGEFSINTKKVLENIKLQLLQKKFGE